MTDRDEVRPVIAGRTKHSDSIDQLNMSDGSILFACNWPGCKFTAPQPTSIPAHYKTHTGKAAQRRRGERRIRRDESVDRLQEVVVEMDDRSKEAMDLMDSVIDLINSLRAEADANKVKADKWDQIVKLIGTDHE